MSWIQVRAAQIVFLLIAFQVPLFRTPCRTGVCESPLEVMVGQLSVSFPIIPEEMLVGVLFPGSITRSFIRSIKTNQPFSLPEYDDVVKEYNLDHFKSVTPVSEFRMEVMAGSYFIVGGAIQLLFKSNRLGVMGALLVLFGMFKQGAFELANESRESEVYPMFWFLAIMTFLSLNLDEEKVKNLVGKVASKKVKSS